MPSVAADAVTSRRGAWHQSSLESVAGDGGCARQWALANILDLPTSPKPSSELGTACHSAVEAHENARLNGNPDGLPLEDMVAIALAHLEKVMPDMVTWPKNKQTGTILTPDDLRSQVRNVLESWYQVAPKGASQSHRDWLLELEPVAVEPYFKVTLLQDTLPLAGWSDGLYRRKDTGNLVIVDFKSTGSFDRWKEGTHRLQATAYAVGILLSGYGAENLDDIEFFYLVSRTTVGRTKSYERSRRLSITVDLHDVQELGDLMRKAQGILDAGEFLPNPGRGPLCSDTWCPFWKDCVGDPTGNGLYRKPFSQIRLELSPTRKKD